MKWKIIKSKKLIGFIVSDKLNLHCINYYSIVYLLEYDIY